MLDIFMNVLLWAVIILGSLNILFLLIIAIFRTFCWVIDCIGVGSVLKELLPMYIEKKKQERKIEKHEVK